MTHTGNPEFDAIMRRWSRSINAAGLARRQAREQDRKDAVLSLLAAILVAVATYLSI